MNDKQKLALKELADVMEKHGIAVSDGLVGDEGLHLFLGEAVFRLKYGGMTARDIRKQLIDAD